MSPAAIADAIACPVLPVKYILNMNTASIVIPVYGQWHLAKRNIDALLKFDRDSIAEILVIDDCSPDKNPYKFNQDYVKIIKNEKNSGYSTTVNNGLKSAKCDIIVLLDSDAYPTGPFIQEVISLYKGDNSVGCVGFATVDDHGNNTGNFQFEPTVIGYVLGQQLQGKFDFLRSWKQNKLLPNSCAVSFKKECLEEVGYFNSDLFPEFEADVDLSMTIHRSKWKLLFAKNIVIVHKGGNSYKVNYKRVLLYHKRRWSLLNKFQRITNPFLVKTLLTARVKLEIVIFQLLTIFASTKEETRYLEKKAGRKALLQEIKLYSCVAAVFAYLQFI